MKRIIASIAAAILALCLFTSCEDIELQVRATLDCHYPSEWKSLIVDPNGDAYVYEGFDSIVLHDEDISFIFGDIADSWQCYGMFDYGVLTTKNYNKLDGKYRYSNHYLFVWDSGAHTYVFKDINDLTLEERDQYLAGRSY
ncbi:MAG: hypothetical protein IK045_06055 [Bacteroidales bacterium]|nr:hypothetical protein [Bacteroidales bacterium]